MSNVIELFGGRRMDLGIEADVAEVFRGRKPELRATGNGTYALTRVGADGRRFRVAPPIAMTEAEAERVRRVLAALESM